MYVSCSEIVGYLSLEDLQHECGKECDNWLLRDLVLELDQELSVCIGLVLFVFVVVMMCWIRVRYLCLDIACLRRWKIFRCFLLVEEEFFAVPPA